MNSISWKEIIPRVRVIQLTFKHSVCITLDFIIQKPFHVLVYHYLTESAIKSSYFRILTVNGIRQKDIVLNMSLIQLF